MLQPIADTVVRVFEEHKQMQSIKEAKEEKKDEKFFNKIKGKCMKEISKSNSCQKGKRIVSMIIDQLTENQVFSVLYHQQAVKKRYDLLEILLILREAFCVPSGDSLDYDEPDMCHLKIKLSKLNEESQFTANSQWLFKGFSTYIQVPSTYQENQDTINTIASFVQLHGKTDFSEYTNYPWLQNTN